MACLQFRKVIKWYSHAIRPPKELYHRLINLSSAALFDETVEAILRGRPDLAHPRPLRAPGSRPDRADRQVVTARDHGFAAGSRLGRWLVGTTLAKKRSTAFGAAPGLSAKTRIW